MKAVFTQKKLLIILIVDLLITVAFPFILFVILKANGVSFTYPFLFAIFAAINGVLSYLSGDLVIVRYKKNNNIVTSALPDEVMVRSREVRWPYIISLVINLLIFAIFAIIYWRTGHWPLM